MNVSFAGLISNIKQKKFAFENKKAIKTIDSKEIVYENYDHFLADLCYSLQETVFSMIQEVAERAIAYTNKSELVLVGGVAANKRFVEMTKAMCDVRNTKYEALPLPLCMDNGVMIAWCGYVEREKASLNIENLKPMPYITIEDKI